MMFTLPLSLPWKVSVRVWRCNWWSSISGRLPSFLCSSFTSVFTLYCTWSFMGFLQLTPHRLSMIEPGPVHTEFETKMMEDVAKMEYPGVDADTVRYFKDVYLPSSIDIFEAMGQMPDDIAKVREQVSCSNDQCRISLITNWYKHSTSLNSNEISQNVLFLLISPVH